ncbi:E3 ubiquitin-protein ligase SDIR1-like [Tasmannia lanceolata]|uniref:E3 ubiquitin-protein ligase SDIR1-like n=1 Tax=Tasmannia lanceolata TaxID=3420 RepID=UPI004063D72E
MSFVFQRSRADIESGFPGFIPERRAVRIHAGARPVNTNSMAFLVTVLLLLMILNSHRMSPNFLVFFLPSEVDYEALRAFDSYITPGAPSMSEDEIDALPVHKYKVQSHHTSTSATQRPARSFFVILFTWSKAKAYRCNRHHPLQPDELTCSVCLDQVNVGELIRSLPCLHQFHVNCIDPWLQQQGTCPVCKFRAGSGWQESDESGMDNSFMV